MTPPTAVNWWVCPDAIATTPTDLARHAAAAAISRQANALHARPTTPDERMGVETPRARPVALTTRASSTVACPSRTPRPTRFAIDAGWWGVGVIIGLYLIAAARSLAGVIS